MLMTMSMSAGEWKLRSNEGICSTEGFGSKLRMENIKSADSPDTANMFVRGSDTRLRWTIPESIGGISRGESKESLGRAVVGRAS